MLRLPSLMESRLLPETGATSLLLTAPTPEPGNEALRHILLGSPDSVRQAIHTLQALKYVEQFRWSDLIKVPNTGILVTPKQGEVMSYLILERPISLAEQ